MSEDTSAALKHALHLFREGAAIIEAALGSDLVSSRAPGMNGEAAIGTSARANGDELVPVKTAARIWGVSENAALKRAKRGHGQKQIDGKWYFRRSVVDAGRCQDAAR